MLQSQLDLWLRHSELYSGLGLDSDFLHPKIQTVNAELTELLARRQTPVVVFQSCSGRMSQYVGEKLIMYNWRKLLICNQKVLKWYQNIYTSNYEIPCSKKKNPEKMWYQWNLSEMTNKNMLLKLSILSELFLRGSKHECTIL